MGIYRQSTIKKQKSIILFVLGKVKKPLSVVQISKRVGLSYIYTRKLLRRLSKEKQVEEIFKNVFVRKVRNVRT